MPREMSMEKKVIKIVNRCQEFIDDMVIGNDGQPVVITDNTYLTMCNDNMEMNRVLPQMFDHMRRLEKENLFLRQSFNMIRKSDWYLKNTDDPQYVKRQFITREQKIDNKRFRGCSCGDWVSNISSYWEQHRKTEKCNSNRLRIKFEKNKFKFCVYGLKLDRLLMLDSHLRVKIDTGVKYQSLENLILKWKLNRCRLNDMKKFYVKDYTLMNEFVYCEYSKYHNLLQGTTEWSGVYYERV